MASDSDTDSSPQRSNRRLGCGYLGLSLIILGLIFLLIDTEGIIDALGLERRWWLRQAAQVDKQSDEELDEALPESSGKHEPASQYEPEDPSEPEAPSKPAVTPTPTPMQPPTPTHTPQAPEPEPDPEALAETIIFEDFILGGRFRALSTYKTGTTAVAGAPDAHSFAKASLCDKALEVYPMPTSAFPGAAPGEGLQSRYRDLVGRTGSDVTWTVIRDAFDLEVNGVPATRMVVLRQKGDRYHWLMLTAMRGPSRATFVHAQTGGIAQCVENDAAIAELTAMSDSVELTTPAAVCYVGQKPESDPASYKVGCDFTDRGFDGKEILSGYGYTEIVLGPAPWDTCAAFMRDHDQPGW